MTTPRSLTRKLSIVYRLWHKKDYDKALARVESLLETWPGNPHLHVLKASLIQLQEEPKYKLDEAREALQQAIELDRGSPAASIELGYFLDNVEDDSKAAASAYGEGVAAARHLLLEGLIGQAKAHRQLGRKEDFKRCLLEILVLAHFDSVSAGNKPEKLQTEVMLHSPSGYVHAIQFNGIPWIRVLTGPSSGKLKGPYVEQVQDLLTELDADR